MRLNSRVLAAVVALALLAACADDTVDAQAASTTTKPLAPLVVAAGDIACIPTMTTTNSRCQEEATAKTVESLHPRAVLALGDLQYEHGEKANFDAVYDKSWGRFKTITHPAIGNHEWSTPKAAGYKSYWAVRGTTYYSFDVGSWHLIALDSNCRSVGGCQPGSPQAQWLTSDLAAHPAKCILAFMHHPRWSSGFHGSDPGYDEFWRILSTAGADVMLAGHDHHYERFGPDRGMRQFVVGTGGRSLYPVVTSEQRTLVHNANTFGVLSLRLGKGTYSWKFVPSVGSFTDAGSAAC